LKAPSIRQFSIYWLPPLLLTAGILVLSGKLGSSPHTQELVKWLFFWLPFPWVEQMEEGHGYLRKAGHVITYAGLYFLWFRAFLGELSFRLRPAILWALSLCLLTAILDEGHQALVPSRDGRIVDVLLDFGASALAALALSFKSR
jgi:VanZ family protein